MPLIVNGETIDDAVIDAEFANVKAHFEMVGKVSCCERDEEFRGYARQNLAAAVLLAQEAKRRIDPPGSDEIDAAVEQVRREQGEMQFAVMLAGNPTEQMENLRRDAEVHLRVRKLMEEVCRDLPEPTDTELREYYEANRAAFMSAEEVRTSHISKNTSRGGDREATYNELREVRRQLLAGADFDELARRHSDKGQELIDLGFNPRGQLPEEYELVAFSMEVGELSPVFSSTYAYHIARVTGRKPPVVKPFEELRDDLVRLMIDARRQEKTRELVEQLKAGASIEYVAAEAETVPEHIHA